MATAHLMVFVETNRFKPDEPQHHAARTVHLPVATRDNRKLIGAALAGLASIWRKGCRYKKAGVVLLDLHPASAVQEGLFDKADTPRRVALVRTVDRLNLRFGRDSVSCRCRHPAAVEAAPGVSVALLYDGVGRAAAGLGAAAQREPLGGCQKKQGGAGPLWKVSSEMITLTILF